MYATESELKKQLREMDKHLIFSKRIALQKIIDEWCLHRNLSANTHNTICALDNLGFLKIKKIKRAIIEEEILSE